MSDIKKQEIEKWVRTWQNASLSLNKIKREELRSNDYYTKNLKVLDEMLQYACDRGSIRPSSGLIEQQRIFMKLRKKD
jgi:hypothetical protein